MKLRKYEPSMLQRLGRRNFLLWASDAWAHDRRIKGWIKRQLELLP